MSDGWGSGVDINEIEAEVARRTAGNPWHSRYDPAGDGYGAQMFVNRQNRELREQAVETFPYLAEWWDHDEVGPLLANAVRNDWDDRTLFGAVYATDWYEQNFGRSGAAAGLRRAGGGGGGGGANREQRIAQLEAILSDQAALFGLQYSPEQIRDLAVRAEDGRWNEAMMIDNLLDGVERDDLTHGQILDFEDQARALAARYLVPMGDDQAHDLAMRIARGELDEAGLRSMFMAQARARFAWMGDQLDQGVTPEDYFAPAREVLARTLEMSAGQIDLMDDRWLGLLEVDDGTGHKRGATLHEAMQAAREQPEWVNTRNAQDTMANMALGVAELFGRR